MSEVKYDSVLVGYAEEPRYNEAGELMRAGASASKIMSSKK